MKYTRALVVGTVLAALIVLGPNAASAAPEPTRVPSRDAVRHGQPGTHKVVRRIGQPTSPVRAGVGRLAVGRRAGVPTLRAAPAVAQDYWIFCTRTPDGTITEYWIDNGDGTATYFGADVYTFGNTTCSGDQAAIDLLSMTVLLDVSLATPPYTLIETGFNDCAQGGPSPKVCAGSAGPAFTDMVGTFNYEFVTTFSLPPDYEWGASLPGCVILPERNVQRCFDIIPFQLPMP